MKGLHGLQDLLQAGTLAAGVIFPIRSGQRKRHQVHAGFRQPHYGFGIQQHPIGGGAHPAAGLFGHGHHFEKIGIQKRLTPTLEVHHAGSGQGRQEFGEGGEGQVPARPSALISRMGAINTGRIAMGGDFHLDPMEFGHQEGTEPTPKQGLAPLWFFYHF